MCEEAWPRATNPDEMHEVLLLLGTLTEDEARNLAVDSMSGLTCSAAEMRAGRFASPCGFLDCGGAAADDSDDLSRVLVSSLRWSPRRAERTRQWERADAVRELIRGRMEVTGPITAEALRDLFQLPVTEIAGALFALEAEGFILRGKFHPGVAEIEWCDRRLLARIHRLTINKLRAEIQPVSIAEYQRFLLAWQRVDAEHRVWVSMVWKLCWSCWTDANCPPPPGNPKC